ncbi:MAG: histidine phosphatase family protein [Chitinophagaceae bacterium]
MLEVILVRHGQSLSNAGQETLIDEAVTLTELGHFQAQQYANVLIEQPAKIIHSPYLRAKETAQPTIKKYTQIPVEQWSVQEFYYLDAHKMGYTNQITRQKYVEAYWRKQDIHYKDGDECESFFDFVSRITHVFKKLAINQTKERIIIFSHGYFIKLSLCLIYLDFPEPTARLMKQFREFALNYDLHNLDTIKVVYEKEKWIVIEHVHTLSGKTIYHKIGKYISF